MKVIIITGSVGTGKTALSKKLARAVRYIYIDANKIIKKYGLAEGYDRRRKSRLIATNNLSKALIGEIKILGKNKSVNGVIIDSHLSHNLPPKYADLCIVTKCDLAALNRRLKRRGYGKAKVRENLDAEIFDVCLEEARKKGHNIIIVDTSKGINNNAFSLVSGWLKKKIWIGRQKS